MKRILSLLFTLMVSVASFAQVSFMEIPLGTPLEEMANRLCNEKKLAIVSKSDDKIVLKGTFWKFEAREITLCHKKGEEYGTGVNCVVVKLGSFVDNLDRIMELKKKMTEKYGRFEYNSSETFECFKWVVDGGEIMMRSAEEGKRAYTSVIYEYIPSRRAVTSGGIDTDF